MFMCVVSARCKLLRNCTYVPVVLSWYCFMPNKVSNKITLWRSIIESFNAYQTLANAIRALFRSEGCKFRVICTLFRLEGHRHEALHSKFVPRRAGCTFDIGV